MTMIKRCKICGVHLIPGPEAEKHMYEKHFNEFYKSFKNSEVLG